MEEIKHEKCARCKTWRTPEHFLNDKGRKLKCCKHCRDKGKEQRDNKKMEQKYKKIEKINTYLNRHGDSNRCLLHLKKSNLNDFLIPQIVEIVFDYLSPHKIIHKHLIKQINQRYRKCINCDTKDFGNISYLYKGHKYCTRCKNDPLSNYPKLTYD